MSIKTQKILRFIPVVNFITMFCWISLCLKESASKFDFIKALLKIFGYLFLVTVIRIAISFIFNSGILDQIAYYISIYPYFFIISWISVQEQEKILSKR